MLALKFPSHAAHILGGNRNVRRHGLLQGDDPGGNKETVDVAVYIAWVDTYEKERVGKRDKEKSHTPFESMSICVMYECVQWLCLYAPTMHV